MRCRSVAVAGLIGCKAATTACDSFQGDICDGDDYISIHGPHPCCFIPVSHANNVGMYVQFLRMNYGPQLTAIKRM